ncbi:MAG TPA: ABC transporter ATP-binding protein, partial [Pseudohongiella sp.]|nr:ABC transporter ATP-binding protein [Pseudohongiella sp.]
MTHALQIDTISVALQNTPIVHDISLQLAQGDIGCLLGPSGCGKTTLLRAIAGFEPVTQGSIQIAGQLVS